ncbi:MAG: hypothetical protein PVH88_01405 [Ignavibacteria bacterium]|jgi:hypothetical protein
MGEEFQDAMYREISYNENKRRNSIIPSEEANIIGSAKISVEEESHDGVKIVLKKDENENIKEIKFVCSCGETKSVILDYNDE